MSILDWAADPDLQLTPYEGALGIAAWDIPAGVAGGPRRGSLEDHGGARLEDEDPDPPRDGTFPYSDIFNGLQAAAAAADKTLPALCVSVVLDLAGNFALSRVTGPGAAAVIGTLGLTVNGTGDVTITWADNTFPPFILNPVVTPNYNTAPTSVSAEMLATGLGVRIKTWNAADAAENRPFTVLVW